MRTFLQSLKSFEKIEWIVIAVTLPSVFVLYHIVKLPRVIVDPLFYLVAGGMSTYAVFCSKEDAKKPIKNRLFGAMLAGAFVWMLIESLGALFDASF